MLVLWPLDPRTATAPKKTIQARGTLSTSLLTSLVILSALHLAAYITSSC
jgi:hypothetical protein